MNTTTETKPTFDERCEAWWGHLVWDVVAGLAGDEDERDLTDAPMQECVDRLTEFYFDTFKSQARHFLDEQGK